MSFLNNPKLPPLLRYLQILIAIAFFVLLCWSSTHRGWWLADHMTGSVALGVVTVLFTFGLSGYHILRHHRTSSQHALSKALLFVLAVANALLLLMYIGTAVIMFRDKGKDYTRALIAPPLITWGIAEGLALLNAVTFALTAFLTVKDGSPAKVTSAGAYV